MAVDLDTIRGLIKTRLESISGITATHKYVPPNIGEADCPQWLIVPDAATHGRSERQGAPPFTGGHATVRTWRLILLLAKSANMPFGDQEKALDPFFERVERELATHIALGSNDPQLMMSWLASDTGPARFQFPPDSGQWWFGCEWKLNVRVNLQGITVER